MSEVREVLRLRGAGLPKKRIAAQLGLDPKTVRRYLTAAETAGVRVTATVGDEEVRQVLLALHPRAVGHRDGWSQCVEQRPAIARWLGDGLRLTKIRKLLMRQGVQIAYSTLHRFAVLELQFGKTPTTSAREESSRPRNDVIAACASSDTRSFVALVVFFRGLNVGT